MTLLEAIDKNLIKVPLTSSSPKDVIEELVSLYADKAGLLAGKKDEIVSRVMARESLGSTAMEKGIAIPHAKIDGVSKTAVIIGVSRLPVKFGGAADTKVFFLVLAPKDNPSEHIQILASIAKAASSSLFVRMLLSSKTKEDVYQLFFE